MIALRKELTEKLKALQSSIPSHPYSIPHRLSLAETYRELGYPDLAAGDAYKALLLIDEVVEHGEYREEAIETVKGDFILEKLSNLDMESTKQSPITEEEVLDILAQTAWSKNAYHLLIRSLLDCGCLRSAFDYISRAKRFFPNDSHFATYDEVLQNKLHSHFAAQGKALDEMDVEEYPDKGLVRRENYPWNQYEPDRFSSECLEFLNQEMAKVAPKLEVKAVDLPALTAKPTEQSSSLEMNFVKQLGLFAKEDITPGEQILEEKSLLTAISRLHDAYCNACSAKLPNPRDIDYSNESNLTIVCEECNEAYFCSNDCHDLAQASYHPAVCGVSMDQETVPASEAADSLYSLLLVRALALSETQNLHPLELKEVRYIWGDYHGLDLDQAWHTKSQDEVSDAFCSVPQTLPFSFHRNVLLPLRMLENMDVNIFTESLRYDTWVFNTLYAKIRGTASAQQGLDGRPEIGAVHPLWCTANHSCAPNVSWEWQGSMQFWARKDVIDWPGSVPAREPGMKKGEEIVSHYCDLSLPVKERREWAVGALGGYCVCPRCIGEEAEERSQKA